MSDIHYLLLSIRPAYANKIFDGSKTIELRRSFPRSYQNGFVVVYVSSPVKAILGGFRIAEVVEDTPSILWKSVQNSAGVSKKEFLEYYDGVSTGFAIFIEQAHLFSQSVSLGDLRTSLKDFDPPQNFRYLKKSQIERLNLQI